MKSGEGCYIGPECKYCKTRMNHPECYIYECPNPECSFKYKFPTFQEPYFTILNESKLKKRIGGLVQE